MAPAAAIVVIFISVLPILTPRLSVRRFRQQPGA
jgi:hypothetical protein